MKKLRVTLNNKVYEVLVEILEDDEGRYPGSTAMPAYPATYLAPPVAPVAAPRYTPPAAPVVPVAAPAGMAAAVTGGVSAPIVGTVTRILVAPGDTVTENQPLIVLDAMKMDTYINSNTGGVIEAILCKTGDTVQVGQKLITFR